MAVVAPTQVDSVAASAASVPPFQGSQAGNSQLSTVPGGPAADCSLDDDMLMQDVARDPLQLFQLAQVKVEQEAACTPPTKKRAMATEDEAAYKSAASSPCAVQYEAAAAEAMKVCLLPIPRFVKKPC